MKGLKKEFLIMYSIMLAALAGGRYNRNPISHSFPDMYYFKVLRKTIKRRIKEMKIENIMKE
jgi:hypothetical protein